MSENVAVDDASERDRDRAARRAAVREFDGALVVEAGAGTGKTAILVARIVVWSLGPGWERAQKRAGEAHADRVAETVLRRVAAITFTDAAAAEMARRVGEALAGVAGDQLPVGIEEVDLPAASPERRDRARALLAALDALQVSTIHAFCRRLLAQFPLAAGLHPGFQIDADGRVLDEVVHTVVAAAARAGYAEPGDPDLLALAVDDIGPAELGEALSVLLTSGRGSEALADDPFAPERVEELQHALRDAVGVLATLEGHQLASVRGPKSVEAGEALHTSASVLEAPVSSAEDVGVLAEKLGEIWDAAGARLVAWSKGTFTKGESAVLDEEAVPPAAANLRALLRHVASLAPEKTNRARRVLAPMLDAARTALRERGAIHFDAMLRETHALLRDHPGICARVRADLDQLLVDEFQDTDALQCEVIRRLALTGEAADRPGLFLVGDPKQSIYGWRNADLRAYDDFVREVTGGVERHRLAVNFRSLPPILDEVERVIAPSMRHHPGLQPAFQRLLPSRGPVAAEAGARASVEHWVSWDRADGDSLGPARTPRAAQLEATALARDLVDLHEHEGVAWSDVGVLFRAMGDVEVYLEALRRAGIPFAVERDRGYYRRREIIDAAALVCCVLDPDDPVALVTWLRASAVGVPDAALLPLWARGFPGAVAELDAAEPDRLRALTAIVDAAAADLPDGVPGLERLAGWDRSLRDACAAIAALRACFEAEPADVFVEALRTLTLFEVSEGARYLGEHRVANLDRFFRDLIRDLDEGDVQAVLRRLRSGVATGREAEPSRPSDAAGQAVRVMTIHKAKGLDFAHTYLVQLHRGSGGRGRSDAPLEIEDRDGVAEYRLFGFATPGFYAVERQRERVERAERIRSLYVAMTRAKNRLVLMGTWPEEPVPVEPERANSFLDLFPARRGGVPDLVGEAARLSAGSGAQGFDACDARWVFPVLVTGGAERVEQAPAPPAPNARALREAAESLARRGDAARARSARPTHRAATAAAEVPAHEERAARHFGERAAALPGDASREAARAAGSAVHRALEDLDLTADADAELARQRGKLAAYVGGTADPTVAAAAVERAAELLDGFQGGALAARLHELRDVIVARELPVLLPAEPEGDGPVGFVAGAIDLLYREPESGDYVIADYKTDRVEKAAELEERAGHYAAQGRSYRRAVREALGLDREPRFELWFLVADQVVVIDA